MVSVSVRWNGKLFKDIAIDPTQPVSVLKNSLHSLTGVPPPRQKILGFKGILQDDKDFSNVTITPGQVLMLVGTAEGHELKEPTERTTFLEDLTEEQQAAMLAADDKKVEAAGLVNTGVTCYLNSVVQFLRPAEELSESLRRYVPSATMGSLDAQVTQHVAELVREMDATLSSSVTPSKLVAVVRQKFPLFARRASNGLGYMQQDAEECLSGVLSCIQSQRIPYVKPGGGIIAGKEPVDEIFGFTLETTTTCTVDGGEPSTTSREHAMKMNVHFGTQLRPVDHLHQGVALALESEFEKKSEVLGRDVLFRSVSRLADLPKMLTLHFVRFEWKKAHDLARTEATRTKICRKIQFSQLFDVFEFCSDELKSELQPARDILVDQLELMPTAKKKSLSSTEDPTANTVLEEMQQSSSAGAVAAGATVAGATVAGATAAGATVAGGEALFMPTGQYELLAVVTHLGRDAETGHYIAWRREDLSPEGDNRYWLKLDDDKVTPVRWNQCDLSGGRSDFHIAVLCMYRQKPVKTTKEVYENARQKRQKMDTEMKNALAKKEANADASEPAKP